MQSTAGVYYVSLFLSGGLQSHRRRAGQDFRSIRANASMRHGCGMGCDVKGLYCLIPNTALRTSQVAADYGFSLSKKASKSRIPVSKVGNPYLLPYRSNGFYVTYFYVGTGVSVPTSNQPEYTVYLYDTNIIITCHMQKTQILPIFLFLFFLINLTRGADLLRRTPYIYI
ncbi:hypothetical protein F4813DRAFT_2658 [Daldinia decipiens]|uniref:uncharacterized protein n=1 Tax=Daldinia decipiens TaxID=326647 RepID=UPI0020C258B4|nr:uncharacterized protein F4813DRAFT_2658 [Daldinia decipiens]KAI1662565.1 hypothetical protein F4813DRAFT_2658 [Daldinia decipiens]